MKINHISTTQIAEICGVSQGTVDRALNNRKGISPKTKEKILSVAQEYGYRPNIHARTMAGGRSQLIGVIVFDLNNQYFSDILTKLEHYCAEKGCSVVVMFTNKNEQKELECIQTLYAMSADGIALCPINSGEAFENYLLSLNLPVVTFGNRLNRISYAGIDNAAAMQDTVNTILDKGYQHLIYVRPALTEKNTYAQTERINTFLRICSQKEVAYTVTDLPHAEQAIASSCQNAFVCPTDLYAIRLLPAAQKHHAGIVGFDNIRFIDELDLKLDSVAYDIDAVAKAMADYIIDQKSIIEPFHHTLICRGSL